MVKAKVYIYAKRFDGLPKEGDLRLVEEDLPPIKDGEFLAEAVYLSVDPYMRFFANTLPLGSTFLGSQVALIKESKNPKFPVGKYVEAQFGWRTHTISDGSKNNQFTAPFVLPDFGDLPLSLALGILGMPGNTAYFGFLDIIKPKAGETVIVSGAAGAVGSVVGQLAKMKECTVIGVAGSDEKGKWLTGELNFDHFINYKTADLDAALSEVAPKGIDAYFDNVGGEITNTILKHMNKFGRISVCGSISGYNSPDGGVEIDQTPVLKNKLSMEGFHAYRWLDQWQEGIEQMLKWVQEGKLKYRETITHGFENMFQAFVGLLEGKNFGKAIVSVK